MRCQVDFVPFLVVPALLLWLLAVGRATGAPPRPPGNPPGGLVNTENDEDE